MAPRLLSPRLPLALTVANRRPADSAWTSLAAAKSVASLPSTLSAFRPVATPVAFVVNGAPVVLATVIEPAVEPVVVNWNAWPPLRLDARTQAGAPAVAAARQP